MRRVVYFPPEGNKPVFKWLETITYAEHEGIMKSDIDLIQCPPSLAIRLNVRAQQPLNQLIRLEYDDLFERKYASLNSSLVAATNGQIKTSWKGPLVAFTGTTDLRNDIVRVQDFTMDQYSALVTYMVALNEYSHESMWSLYREITGPKVQAVMVIQASERAEGRPAFQTVEISLDHPAYLAKFDPAIADMFTSRGTPGEISPISELIGMPLIAWKYESEKRPGVRGEHCNEDITFMFISIKEDVDWFGFAPLRWTGGRVPNVLLTRSDQEMLDVETATAFAAYCHYHVLPFTGWALENLPRTNASIRWALEQVTPAKWALYLKQWQKLRANSPEVTSTQVSGMPRMGLTKADQDTVVSRFLP